MKKLWILSSLLMAVLIASVLSSFFYQTELTKFFSDIGWEKFAGFVSGSWWASAPSWVLAAIAVFTFTIAIQQITQSRKSTNAQIVVGLFQELRSDKALEILRYIYALPPDEDGKYLTTAHKNNIDYILGRLGMMGSLLANGIIDKKLAIETFGGVTAIKCWYKLRQYIEEIRKKQGLQRGAYAEDFASRALRHWKRHKRKWILYYRNEGDEPIDLVEKLSLDKELCPRSLKQIKNEIKKKDTLNLETNTSEGI